MPNVELAVLGFELTLGLVLLLGGGEALVNGSVSVAIRLRVSPFLVGLLFIGFGTSAPELAACIDAALAGAPAIAVGNIVGSNIANILLVIGLSAVILPIITPKTAWRRDGIFLILASLLLVGTVLASDIARWTGLFFLVLLLGYMIFCCLTDRVGQSTSDIEATQISQRPISLPMASALALGGLAGVLIGADMLVGSAIVLAKKLEVSEALIGLTLVAIGTSLPELVTCVIAALRRHGDIALGNIVGSNIFNSLGVAGATAIVVPIEVPTEIARLDIWIMLGAVLLLGAFARTNWRVSRQEGAILLLAYAAYLGILVLRHSIGLA
jgi:cation:H+ antiporter